MSNIFEKGRLDGNFLIPADRSIRSEMLHELRGHRCSGRAYMPGNEVVQRQLKARICAIEAYEKALGWE